MLAHQRTIIPAAHSSALHLICLSIIKAYLEPPSSFLHLPDFLFVLFKLLHQLARSLLPFLSRLKPIEIIQALPLLLLLLRSLLRLFLSRRRVPPSFRDSNEPLFIRLLPLTSKCLRARRFKVPERRHIHIDGLEKRRLIRIAELVVVQVA